MEVFSTHLNIPHFNKEKFGRLVRIVVVVHIAGKKS